jgi:hypothetical protein
MVDISERTLDNTIERALLAGGPDAIVDEPAAVRERQPDYGEPWPAAPGGYRGRSQEEYDKARCPIGRDAIDFVNATQPKIWQRLQERYGDETRARLNTPENARLTVNSVVSKELQDLADTKFNFYKPVTDDEGFARHFLDWLFERVRTGAGR